MSGRKTIFGNLIDQLVVSIFFTKLNFFAKNFGHLHELEANLDLRINKSEVKKQMKVMKAELGMANFVNAFVHTTFYNKSIFVLKRLAWTNSQITYIPLGPKFFSPSTTKNCSIFLFYLKLGATGNCLLKIATCGKVH